MHKVGIMQGRVLPDRLDRLQVFPSKWQRELQAISVIGFEFVELLYDREEDHSNPLVTADHDKLDEALRNARLVPMSICADYFTKVNFFRDPPHQTWDVLSKLLYAADWLNVSYLVLPFFDQNILDDTKDLRAFISELQNREMTSKLKNTTLCLESTLTAAQTIAVLGTGQPGIRVCFDSGNTVAMGLDIAAEVLTLGNQIAHVHLKDRLANNGPNVLLGSGAVDFTALFNALRTVNYQGHFTLETAIGTEPSINAARHYNFIMETLKCLNS